jgi:acid stress chaperone HdeB
MKTPKKTFALFVSGLLIALLSTTSAQAQVSIDIAKITCDQFTLFKVTDPRNIAIWISGYYSGKRNNTVIDTQQLNEYYDKLKTHCSANPTRTVMQAVEILFGPPPK